MMSVDGSMRSPDARYEVDRVFYHFAKKEQEKRPLAKQMTVIWSQHVPGPQSYVNKQQTVGFFERCWAITVSIFRVQVDAV